MRSTKKQIETLYKELADGIGTETRQEAQAHLRNASRYFAKKLNAKGFTSVSVSAYRGNSWSLSAFTNGATFETFYFTTERLLDEPFSIAREFISKAEAALEA